MDHTQRRLFGTFPRRVGTPNQHWVFSEAQFDLFTETVGGSRGAYVTVTRLPLDGSVEADKVFYDFDGDKSALPPGSTEDEWVSLMRDDPDVAEAVLRDALMDARTLVERTIHDGIPVVVIYSGFGFHVHQLYEPTREGVRTKMGSTARRYIDLLDLETADPAVIGDEQRICRIPNVERASHGRGTGLWTIPISPSALQNTTPHGFVTMADGPVDSRGSLGSGRPEMGVFTDYTEGVIGSDGLADAAPVETFGAAEGDMRGLLESLIRMPCMVDRLLQPNPSHPIRVNGAVMLFNLGMTVGEVTDLFGRLGWTDWDRETTKKQLRHIHRKGYNDMSCHTLRRKGYCTVENPESCETFGWAGGNPEWKGDA